MTQAPTGTERLEFGSPAWMRRLGATIAELVAAEPSPDVKASFSEEYVDVPAEHQGSRGWFVEVQGGDVRFETAPRRDADVVLVVDFAFARSHLLEISADDVVTRRRLRDEERRALAAGRVVVLGDLSAAPPQLAGLRDAAAAWTVQPAAVVKKGN
jgi:hypothetical protein